jgi:hypothetical protein
VIHLCQKKNKKIEEEEENNWVGRLCVVTFSAMEVLFICFKKEKEKEK